MGSKIIADGDCSHELKRRLLLGRKAMTNLDNMLKSRDITLPTKVHPVKARLRGSTVKRSYPTSEVRGRSPEEILHVQGKRNPSKMVVVARGHQRADTLKP